MSNEPEVRQLSVNGIQLCVFCWGADHLPPVLLVHATGFHARCWDQIVQPLTDDYRVYAVDMRGHGRSDKTPPYLWRQFSDDLLQVARQLGLQQAVAVGHSMGGHCVAQVAADDPSLFAELLLVDPVIFAPEWYQGDQAVMYPAVEDHPVARRKGHFASWQEMHERYAQRHPYSLWQPQVFEDYCRYGVLPAADGDGVDLACPPIVEASIYNNNFTNDIHPHLAKLTLPVTILRAPPRDPDSLEMDFSASPTWPQLASILPNAKDILLEHLTHFIPMLDSDLVVKYVRQACHNVAQRQLGEIE